MFQLLSPSCLHLLNAIHSNQKRFLHSHHFDEWYKQWGILSRHSTYSLSAWTSQTCKEASGSCLRALKRLLEHCNKDYMNFTVRELKLLEVSLLPSTTNTGQFKVTAVLKPQFFSSHNEIGHDDHGWFMPIKNCKTFAKKQDMKHSISGFIIMNSVQHNWPWQ